MKNYFIRVVPFFTRLIIDSICFKYSLRFVDYRNLSRKALDKLALDKLNSTLLYAYNNNTFYRTLWDSNDVKLPLKTLLDFNTLPIVTKDMIRVAMKNKSIFSKGFPKDVKLSWSETTGSSGMPFRFPVTSEESLEITAYSRIFYKWFGFHSTRIKVKFWRSTLNKSFYQKFLELLKGEYVFCIYEIGNIDNSLLTNSRMHNFVKRLNKLKPEIIEGYATALVDMSRYIIDNNLKLSFTPLSIVSGAEELTSADRILITKAFGCSIFNRYAGTDSTMIAHECAYQSTHNNYLHICEQKSYIETVDNKGNKIYDKPGAVVITDYTRKYMPFIRYAVGDLATIGSKETCKCGRKTHLITCLNGRVNDTIYTKSGRILNPNVWTFFRKYLWVLKYQVVWQDNMATILIKKDLKAFTSAGLRALDRELKAFGDDFKFKIVFVKDIPPAAGGKIKQIIVKE